MITLDATSLLAALPLLPDDPADIPQRRIPRREQVGHAAVIARLRVVMDEQEADTEGLPR